MEIIIEYSYSHPALIGKRSSVFKTKITKDIPKLSLKDLDSIKKKIEKDIEDDFEYGLKDYVINIEKIYECKRI